MTVIKFASAIVAAVSVAEATYRSGSVSSYEKFTYGKFVTRMKAPDKMGTVSSFFTYWDGPDFKPAEWNELDIEIVPSVEHNPMSMNVIFGDGHDKKESHQYAQGFNPKDEWHTYTMEWTPEYIAWSIDGHEVRHINAEDPSVKHMAKEQSLRMNFWTPTFHSWGHDLDATDMPWFLLYDYVEVFTWNADSNEFDLHWRDDFNNFDDKRWHKASGGFASNSSVFHPENVSVKAGNLVLKMEPEEVVAEKHHAVTHHAVVEHEEVETVKPVLGLAHSDRHRAKLSRHHHKEHFGREHARSRQPTHDEKFWRISHEEQEQEEDGIHIDVEHDDDDFEDSSDSEADW